MSVVSSITKYPMMMKSNSVDKNINRNEEEVLKEYNQRSMQDVVETNVMKSLQLDQEDQREFDKNITDSTSETRNADSEVKRVKYAVQQRYSDMELIEKADDEEDSSEARMKLMKTLPPKYSDESDIRNNIICTNSNIYIYAENKNGNLNEEACISVSDDNKVIYCSTRGRRYTIGGYANIEKKLNNEYHFFEDANPMSAQSSKNTFSFDAFQGSELPSSLGRLNFSRTNECSDESIQQLSSRTNMLMDAIHNNTYDSNLSSTNSLSGNYSVQKLFKDYKKFTQNLEHDQRTCKPCAHVYNGSTCMNGDECAFCHHPDHVLISAKKWKKLVKNNMEKLDMILHVLRNPNDANSMLLKEMIMPSQNSMSGKKMNSRNYKTINTNTLNHNMNSPMINPMNYYNKKNRYNKKFVQQKNMETMMRSPYHFYDSNEGIPMNRGRNYHYHVGYTKGYMGKSPNMQTHNINVNM